MTETAELIVYATPEGELADQCREFWAFAAEIGATTAQAYPPHVTLTGFFRRPPAQIEPVRAELDTALAAGPAPVKVDVVALRYQPLEAEGELWLGLEVASPDLQAVMAALVADNDPGVNDRLRPKDWLHLSLAYGGVDDLDPYHERARATVNPAAVAEWNIGLWERTPGGIWHQHSSHRL